MAKWNRRSLRWKWKAPDLTQPRCRLKTTSALLGGASALWRDLISSKAVLFSIANQAWVALVAPATMVVIATSLSPSEQGFYYTFSSLLALHVVVEMGLAPVIVQVASHESASLECTTADRLKGDPGAISKLSSLLRIAMLWYLVAGIIICVGLGLVGWTFLSSKPDEGISWRVPWVLLATATGLSVIATPVLSVIEGCNRVDSIYSFRFLQSVITAVVTVAGIIGGLGLYTLPLAALARFSSAVGFIGLKHRTLISQLIGAAVTHSLNWSKEVWPFQWRMGVSSLAGYFISYIFTPVMFYYHGAAVAGQMGMSWALATGVETLALAWLGTKMPEFGRLVARREFKALDRLFARLVATSLGVMFTGSSCLILAIWWIKGATPDFGARVLPLLPFSLLVIQKTLNLPVIAMAWYLRAHKTEPMMVTSLVVGFLTGLSTWVLGSNFGPTGATAGYLGIVLCVALPMTSVLFINCRRRWHHES